MALYSAEANTQRAISMSNAKANDVNRIDSVHLQADPYANRVPEYYVGIFNVSETELRCAKPWGKAGRTSQGDSAREVVIPGREKEALYGKPYILRDVEPILRTFVGTDELSYTPTSGELLAQDLVNSNDPRGNWRTYRALNPATSFSEGNNYYERGIFWCRLSSPDAEPDMEAVEMAITRLEKYYNGLVSEARQYWSGDPKGRAFISRPHHDAAEYFQIDEPWHNMLRGVSLNSKLAEAKAKQAAQKAAQPSPKV